MRLCPQVLRMRQGKGCSCQGVDLQLKFIWGVSIISWCICFPKIAMLMRPPFLIHHGIWMPSYFWTHTHTHMCKQKSNAFLNALGVSFGVVVRRSPDPFHSVLVRWMVSDLNLPMDPCEDTLLGDFLFIFAPDPGSHVARHVYTLFLRSRYTVTVAITDYKDL